MDAHLVEATIKTYLTEIRNRLDRAAGIGRAADACASAGFQEKGLEVALDTEQLLYEATTLLSRKSDQPDRPTKPNALLAGADREASDRSGRMQFEQTVWRPGLLSKEQLSCSDLTGLLG